MVKTVEGRIEPASSEEGSPAIVPPKHLARWICGGLVLLVVGAIGISLYRNPNIDHSTIGEFLFARPIMDGVKVTVLLTLGAMVVGVVFGVALGLMRVSNNPVLSTVSLAYVWIFRAVPLLVQLLVWGNFALLFKRVYFGIPYSDLNLGSVDSNQLFTVFVAATLGLGLHEAAYMAEIVRAGLLSVDEGQKDAAKSLGMGSVRMFWYVTIPQAMRVIIPPTGNQLIGMIKATSLVYVIAGGDLLTNAQNISALNLKVVELLVVASIWYLVLVSLASWGQHHLEAYFARGATRSNPVTLRNRVIRKMGAK